VGDSGEFEFCLQPPTTGDDNAGMNVSIMHARTHSWEFTDSFPPIQYFVQ